MNKAQIKHMVDRFLAWRLPDNFNPDNGITAVRPNYAPEVSWEPTGTNLLDAMQAEAMVRHMADEIPESHNEFAWLIEAPGQNYLGIRKIGHSHDFYWTDDHTKALRFHSQEQADAAMMAVRQLAPYLWAFAANLGEARPVEHGWIATGSGNG